MEFSSSPGLSADLGQALGPILESRADKSGDNEKPHVIISMYTYVYRVFTSPQWLHLLGQR